MSDDGNIFKDGLNKLFGEYSPMTEKSENDESKRDKSNVRSQVIYNILGLLFNLCKHLFSFSGRPYYMLKNREFLIFKFLLAVLLFK